MHSKLHSNWQNDVLSFWFETLTPKQWFQSSKTVDDAIQNQFEPLIDSVAQQASSIQGLDSHSQLAAILVLDQFPRNCYRGSPKAFDYDPIALTIAQGVTAQGLDSAMSQPERQFCYMPFMHSENLAHQNQSLELFNNLGVEGGISSAVEHRDIITQFGRFPHRNEVLSRQSTREELEYLTDAKRFGQ